MAMNALGKIVRLIVLAAPFFVVTGAAFQPAKADAHFEWCALYGKGSSVRICSFHTLEQCSDAVPVGGGWCQLNPLNTSLVQERDINADDDRPDGNGPQSAVGRRILNSIDWR